MSASALFESADAAQGPWLPDDGFDMLDLLRRHKKRRLD